MTEGDARDWIASRFGGSAVDRVGHFLDRVIGEASVQNLISPSTISCIWARHGVDSAQLLDLAPEGWMAWLDIGTGGGFPGMIIALLERDRAVMMVEPRARRAEFLQECAVELGLINADVRHCKVEVVTWPADVISARAVAQPQLLLHSAAQCAKATTTWLFPRGQSATAVPAGPIMFHVEHSVTDARSVIHVGKGCPL